MSNEPTGRPLRRVVGVILAGGASSRMGTPKHALPTGDGRTFGQSIHDALLVALRDQSHGAGRAETCAPPRIVVAGLTPGAPTIGDLQHIPDRTPGLGPLGGLDAAMRVLRNDAEHLLVAPCDMPMLTADTLRALLVPTDSQTTVFGHDDGIPRPLPMRIALTTAAIVFGRLHASDRSLRRLVADCTTRRIDCPNPEQLQSINTPADRDAFQDGRDLRLP